MKFGNYVDRRFCFCQLHKGLRGLQNSLRPPIDVFDKVFVVYRVDESKPWGTREAQHVDIEKYQQVNRFFVEGSVPN